MKRVFCLLLFSLSLSLKSKAIDTVRYCGYTDLYGYTAWCPTPGAYESYTYLNGVDVGALYPGDSGILTIVCYYPYPPFPPAPDRDTSFYIRVAGTPQICYVTVDSNNNPVIFFDQASLIFHSSLALRKQLPAQNWQTIAAINTTNTTNFTDTVNAASRSFRYVLKSNSCPQISQYMPLFILPPMETICHGINMKAYFY